MGENQEQIKDEQVTEYYNQNQVELDVKTEKLEQIQKNNYDKKLEEKIEQIYVGKRIKALEKRGFPISLENVVEEYVAINGRTFDEYGNIKIDEQSLNMVCSNHETIAEKATGIRIKNIPIKNIKDITLSEEYIGIRENTGTSENIEVSEKFEAINSAVDEAKSELEMIINPEDILKMYESDNIFDDFIEKDDVMRDLLDRLDNIRDMDNSDSNLKSDFGSNYDQEHNEDIEKIRKKNNESEDKIPCIEDSETKIDYDSDFVEICKYLRMLDVEKEKFDPKEYEKTKNILLIQLNRIKEKSIHRKEFSSKKEISLEDAISFVNKYDQEVIKDYIEFNRAEVLKQLEKGPVDLKTLANVFALSSELTDKKDKKRLVEFAKELKSKGISLDILENSEKVINEEAVKDLYENAYGEKLDSKKIMSNARIEYLEKTKQENKSNAKKRPCSEKEAIMYSIINARNTYGPRGYRFYKHEDKKIELLLLYSKLRDDELKETTNYKGKKTERNINSRAKYSDSLKSGIIKKYMLEHYEYYQDYIDKNGNISLEAIEEATKQLKDSNLRNVKKMYTYIVRETQSIEIDERAKSRELNQARSLLDEISVSTNKGTKEYQQKVEELWKQVESLPKSILPTVMLEQLSNLDRKKTKTVVGKGFEKKIKEDSFHDFLASGKRLGKRFFQELPKMIVNKETRDKYVPKIAEHLRSGSKRLIKLFIPKSMRKEALPPGNEEKIEGQVENLGESNDLARMKDTKINVKDKNENEDSTNQKDSFDERLKAGINVVTPVINKNTSGITNENNVKDNKQEQDEIGEIG